ncbi:hypothetical protein K438DRAFT_577614 [Mycena galopus ATCC 62051]|nr:hypothetical protein K438DRAFT_577614 [Mycena galopus ATCC 62051]
MLRYLCCLGLCALDSRVLLAILSVRPYIHFGLWATGGLGAHQCDDIGVALRSPVHQREVLRGLRRRGILRPGEIHPRRIEFRGDPRRWSRLSNWPRSFLHSVRSMESSRIFEHGSGSHRGRSLDSPCTRHTQHRSSMATHGGHYSLYTLDGGSIDGRFAPATPRRSSRARAS